MNRIIGKRISMSVLAVGSALVLTSGCGGNSSSQSASEIAYANANLKRGGLLYDKWWDVVDGGTEPTGNHALYQDAGKTGADSWRCKECHGWDYKGKDGKYATGSHYTGIKGILGTAKTAQEVYDLMKGTHQFAAAGRFAEADLWDVTKFAREGTIDEASYINSDKTVNGSADAGNSLYLSKCSSCHGADGKTINLAHDPGETEYMGMMTADNPWETLHKIRFGNPGTEMPQREGELTVQQMIDIIAHAQTLPTM